jgi:hypothetical protein
MSENKALVLQPSMSLFPSAEELSLIKEQAAIYIASGLLPKSVDKPEKAILIMLKGRELGIPPLQALAGIFVVEGKTVLGAELMTAQVYRNCPGAQIDIVETTNTVCRVVAARPGKPPVEFKTTIQDAQAAGVAGKDNWRKYPAQMLRWRTLSNAAKSIFPDAVAGCLTPDEAEEAGLGGASNEDKAARLSALNKKPEMKEVESVVVESPSWDRETTPLHGPKPDPVKTVAEAVIAAEPEPSWDAELSQPEPTEFDPLAAYTLKGGHSLKGKKIGEIDRATLSAFLLNTREFFKRNNRPITGVNLEDVTRIDDYLRTSEPQMALETEIVG